MKKSTEVIEPNNWSWLADAFTFIFSALSGDEKIISLVLFKQLPGDALLHISSYLPLRGNPGTQKKWVNRALMFSLSYDKDVDPIFKRLLHENYLLDKFLYLIAIEGEDNQNKAETILKQLSKEKNYALLSKLISSQTAIFDAAGRRFESISAFGYTFWAGDTRMSRMLEKYISILNEQGYDTQQNVFNECMLIETQGITFSFNNVRVKASKRFDWQPLIAAYNNYIDEAQFLIEDYEDRRWCADDLMMNSSWLKIGEELAKVPTSVAQEYCSDVPFSPLSAFKAALNRPALKRTVQIYSRDEDARHAWLSRESKWFSWDMSRLKLGSCISIYKDKQQVAVGVRLPQHTKRVISPNVDFAAISALREIRMVHDRVQTLENLKPQVPNLNFYP